MTNVNNNIIIHLIVYRYDKTDYNITIWVVAYCVHSVIDYLTCNEKQMFLKLKFQG